MKKEKNNEKIQNQKVKLEIKEKNYIENDIWKRENDNQ